MLRIHRIGGIRRFPSGGTAHCYATFSLFLLTIWGGRTEGVWYDNYRRGESPVFEIILWEVSLKNKRGRLFFNSYGLLLETLSGFGIVRSVAVTDFA